MENLFRQANMDPIDAYNLQEQQLQDFVKGTKYKVNTKTNYIITGETSVSVKIERNEEDLNN